MFMHIDIGKNGSRVAFCEIESNKSSCHRIRLAVCMSLVSDFDLLVQSIVHGVFSFIFSSLLAILLGCRCRCRCCCRCCLKMLFATTVYFTFVIMRNFKLLSMRMNDFSTNSNEPSIKTSLTTITSQLTRIMHESQQAVLVFCRTEIAYKYCIVIRFCYELSMQRRRFRMN